MTIFLVWVRARAKRREQHQSLLGVNEKSLCVACVRVLCENGGVSSRAGRRRAATRRLRPR